MGPAKIFLASSIELANDRKDFALLISNRNTIWHRRGIFLELVNWENFDDSVSKFGKQQDYNESIRKCDIFVMLFFTKIGRYTKEEFDTAYAQFSKTNKPRIYTYWKDEKVNITKLARDDLKGLWDFIDELKRIEHFWTPYDSVSRLQLEFSKQLEILDRGGFFPSAHETKSLGPGEGFREAWGPTKRQ